MQTELRAEICETKLRFDKEPKVYLVARVPVGTRVELRRADEILIGRYAGIIAGKPCIKLWGASDSMRYVYINRSDKVKIL